MESSSLTKNEEPVEIDFIKLLRVCFGYKKLFTFVILATMVSFAAYLSVAKKIYEGSGLMRVGYVSRLVADSGLQKTYFNSNNLMEIFQYTEESGSSRVKSIELVGGRKDLLKIRVIGEDSGRVKAKVEAVLAGVEKFHNSILISFREPIIGNLEFVEKEIKRLEGLVGEVDDISIENLGKMGNTSKVFTIIARIMNKESLLSKLEKLRVRQLNLKSYLHSSGERSVNVGDIIISDEPVGTGHKKMFIIFLILGITLSFMLIFFIEIWKKIKYYN